PGRQHRTAAARTGNDPRHRCGTARGREDCDAIAALGAYFFRAFSTGWQRLAGLCQYDLLHDRSDPLAHPARRLDFLLVPRSARGRRAKIVRHPRWYGGTIAEAV